MPEDCRIQTNVTASHYGLVLELDSAVHVGASDLLIQVPLLVHTSILSSPGTVLSNNDTADLL